MKEKEKQENPSFRVWTLSNPLSQEWRQIRSWAKQIDKGGETQVEAKKKMKQLFDNIWQGDEGKEYPMERVYLIESLLRLEISAYMESKETTIQSWLQKRANKENTLNKLMLDSEKKLKNVLDLDRIFVEFENDYFLLRQFLLKKLSVWMTAHPGPDPKTKEKEKSVRFSLGYDGFLQLQYEDFFEYQNRRFQPQELHVCEEETSALTAIMITTPKNEYLGHVWTWLQQDEKQKKIALMQGIRTNVLNAIWRGYRGVSKTMLYGVAQWAKTQGVEFLFIAASPLGAMNHVARKAGFVNVYHRTELWKRPEYLKEEIQAQLKKSPQTTKVREQIEKLKQELDTFEREGLPQDYQDKIKELRESGNKLPQRFARCLPCLKTKENEFDFEEAEELAKNCQNWKKARKNETGGGDPSKGWEFDEEEWHRLKDWLFVKLAYLDSTLTKNPDVTYETQSCKDCTFV